jgi:hypothetical protein
MVDAASMAPHRLSRVLGKMQKTCAFTAKMGIIPAMSLVIFKVYNTALKICLDQSDEVFSVHYFLAKQCQRAGMLRRAGWERGRDRVSMHQMQCRVYIHELGV